MRRITNWDALTPGECAGTQRRVAERNQGRLAECRRLKAAGQLRQPAAEAAAEAAVEGESAAERAAGEPVEELDLDALLDVDALFDGGDDREEL